MTISVLIATFGDESWARLARRRALPSALSEQPHEVLIEHYPEATIAEARNQLAAQASGDWLIFLDADDELEPGYLAAMSVSGSASRLRLFTPQVLYVPGPRRRGGLPRFWPEGDIRRVNWLVIGTMISRQLFTEIGGFRDYGWSEDWDLWARAIRAGASVVKVPEAVYVAYVQSRSRNRAAPRAERLYWHQRIGHDNWPDLYEQPTEAEDAGRLLTSRRLRMSEAL